MGTCCTGARRPVVHHTELDTGWMQEPLGRPPTLSLVKVFGGKEDCLNHGRLLRGRCAVGVRSTPATRSVWRFLIDRVSQQLPPENRALLPAGAADEQVVREQHAVVIDGAKETTSLSFRRMTERYASRLGHIRVLPTARQRSFEALLFSPISVSAAPDGGVIM